MITFDYPYELDLSFIGVPEGESYFMSRQDIESLVPGAMDLVEDLMEIASEEAEMSWQLTEMYSNPWLHVMHGPVDGISWHDEGIRDDNYSLVYALNDSDAALEFEDKVMPHRRGRAVVFKSSTKHRVQRLNEKGYRYALAFLMHGEPEDD